MPKATYQETSALFGAECDGDTWTSKNRDDTAEYFHVLSQTTEG